MAELFILDTDHFTLLEWNAGEAQHRLLNRMSPVSPSEIFTTIITYEEQTSGWMAYAARARTTTQQIEAYSKLERHLDIYRPVQVLGFDEPAGRIFEQLKQLRLRVGSMDMKIAAIALANQATLLTRNLKDFNRIPDLQIEDWSV